MMEAARITRLNELRVAGITTVPAPNRYLHERFLATYDARFTHAPVDPASAFGS